MDVVLPELAVVEWSAHDVAAASVCVAVKLLCPSPGQPEKTSRPDKVRII